MGASRREKIAKRKPNVYNFVQKKLAKEGLTATPRTPRILTGNTIENINSPGKKT
jgi:hypothetical protein